METLHVKVYRASGRAKSRTGLTSIGAIIEITKPLPASARPFAVRPQPPWERDSVANSENATRFERLALRDAENLATALIHALPSKTLSALINELLNDAE